MKYFRLYSFFLFMGIVAGIASAEPAAESRGLRGTGQDTSGALIAGAEVIVTTEEGNTVAQGSTDNSGGFHFADLPPGSYSIDITKEGFREARQSIRIGSSPHSPLHIVLPVVALITINDTNSICSPRSKRANGSRSERRCLLTPENR